MGGGSSGTRVTIIENTGNSGDSNFDFYMGGVMPPYQGVTTVNGTGSATFFAEPGYFYTITQGQNNDFDSVSITCTAGGVEIGTEDLANERITNLFVGQQDITCAFYSN